MTHKASLLKVYDRLFKAYGPQQWWPGETPFEVIVGAILTQNTNWKNVEKAIFNLKREGVLQPHSLNTINSDKLADLIRPSGFFNIKTKRLKAFIDFLYESFNGDLDRMFSLELNSIRKKLLEINGIGPETADSILLYAGNHPTFVVDSYTRRIFTRLDILPENKTYHEIRDFFMENLEVDVDLYNEYHALIVRHAKEYCRSRPDCQDCPLLTLPCKTMQKCLQHRSTSDNS